MNLYNYMELLFKICSLLLTLCNDSGVYGGVLGPSFAAEWY